MNAHLDPRTTHPEFFRKHGFVSYLGLPLIVKGESLGVLSFYTTQEHRVWSRGDQLSKYPGQCNGHGHL